MVPIEKIVKTYNHREFIKNNHDKLFNSFIDFVCTERYFLLENFIYQANLKNVIYIECDVMVYFSYKDLLDVFEKKYQTIATTIFNEKMGVASIMYIPRKENLRHFTCYILEKISNSSIHSLLDMSLLGEYALLQGNKVNLPIIFPEYENTFALKSIHGVPFNYLMYMQHYKEFDSIFDVCTIGQFLGGTYLPNSIGYHNLESIFDPNKLKYI